MNFSASRALTEGLEILKSRFGVLLGTALVFYAALIAVFAGFGGTVIGVMMAGARGGDPLQTFGGMGLSILAFYLMVYAVQFAQQLALMRACSDRHSGTIGDAIGAGIRGMPSLFAAVFLLVVLGGAVMVILSITVGLAMAAANSFMVSLIIGIVCLVGLIFLIARLSMITPVIAIDEVRNPVGAIARSWRLTSAAAFKIAAVFIAAALLMGALFFVAALATLGTAMLSGAAASSPSPAGVIGFMLAMLILGLTVGLYFTALMAAIHRQLSDGGAEEAGETFS